MLTIEIPEKIRQLVAIAQMGEFPASCWATEIVSNWLYDVAEHAGYDDPQKCPMSLALCKELGIHEGHDGFVAAGGELYRSEATRLLTRALAHNEDKPAFLRVSAMVIGQLMLSNDRKTIELSWENVVPGFEGLTPSQENHLPMPVWQCLMRYYAKDWRDPISAWHHDVLSWIRTGYETISYSADQLVPFPAKA